jgi:3-oxoacyl-[acyl-carrier protein] reductase
MNVDLSGKVAIVTGAGRGIGRGVALRLAEEGVSVVGLDVSAESLPSLGEDLANRGTPGQGAVCDVTDEHRVQQVVAEVADRYGRIDILLNNAGVSTKAPTDLLTERAWRLVHDVNLMGTFLMCKAVMPVMKRQRSGRIINAASFAALMPVVGHAAYASSKAAVVHFTRTIAGELGPWGVTANSYAPGMVPTTLNHYDEREQAEQDRLLSTLTLRRWERTDDIADLICFLASDRAGYITGTMIDVSGGKFATQHPSSAYSYAASGDPDVMP